jgi:hypothetical protein
LLLSVSASKSGVETLLESLNRIARWLLPRRMLFLGLALFALLMLIVSLFAEEVGEQGLFAIPALTLFLWGFSVFVFILNFAVIPQRQKGESGMFRRGLHYLQRAWYWLVGLFFLSTTLVLLTVTTRLVIIWLRDFF